MSYTLNKSAIEEHLKELIGSYLDRTIPYEECLEYHGVLGIKLDDVQEFFVCLDQTRSKPQQVDEENSPSNDDLTIKQEAVAGEMGQGTKKVVLTGNNYETLISLLKGEEGSAGIRGSGESVVDVHNYALSREDINLNSVTDASESNTDLAQDEITLDSIVYAPEQFASSDPAELEVTANVAETASLVGSQFTIEGLMGVRSRRGPRIYKLPKGHLDNPPCECCHVLYRYRQKDRDATARIRAINQKRPPPPYQDKTNKIIYKLARDHVDACMCCIVLASRRNYMKQISRRKRERQYTSRESERRMIYNHKSRLKVGLGSDVTERSQVMHMSDVTQISEVTQGSAVTEGLTGRTDMFASDTRDGAGQHGLDTITGNLQSQATNSRSNDASVPELSNPDNNVFMITETNATPGKPSCAGQQAAVESDISLSECVAERDGDHTCKSLCKCCEVLHRFNLNVSRAKQRRVARNRGGDEPPMLDGRAPYYKLSPDHKDICSCCERLASLRSRPSRCYQVLTGSSQPHSK